MCVCAGGRDMFNTRRGKDEANKALLVCVRACECNRIIAFKHKHTYTRKQCVSFLRQKGHNQRCVHSGVMVFGERTHTQKWPQQQHKRWVRGRKKTKNEIEIIICVDKTNRINVVCVCVCACVHERGASNLAGAWDF